MPLVTMEMNFNNAFKKHEISPDIIPENFTPSTLLSVVYPSGQEAALGNFIKPSESSEKPHITFVAPDKEAQYTLMLVDPDAPSKEDPKWGPYRHWVVTNITASGELTSAHEMATYQGPAPPPKTNDHRYIFLLFKQPESNTSFQALSEEANNWDFKAFVQQNNLELIGANFFISRNDDN
ncbi:phosphatidylethanolamine-binding protein [Blakeslea trispora]|nr:phosphatidylethanolamine-binding protein [Blakeslea trispora]